MAIARVGSSTRSIRYSSATPRVEPQHYPVPTFADQAAVAIRDINHLQDGVSAYHEDVMCWDFRGRLWRVRGTVRVLVPEDNGTVLEIRQGYERVGVVDVGRGPRRRRGKGGAGQRIPVTMTELIERARNQGAGGQSG